LPRLHFKFYKILLTSIFIYLFICDEIVQEYTKNTKKNKKKQMNKELDYDTHNDSIIRSMSATLDNMTI